MGYNILDKQLQFFEGYEKSLTPDEILLSLSFTQSMKGAHSFIIYFTYMV